MDPLSIAMLVGAGVSLINGISNNVQANKQRHASEDQYKEDREYNSSANQVRRLREAGLNAGIAASNGGITAGNTSSLPHQAQQPELDLSGVQNSIYQAAEIQNQTSQTKSDVGLKNAQAEGERLKNMTILQEAYARIDKMIADKGVSEETKELLKQQKNEILINLQTLGQRNEAALANTEADTNLKRAQERSQTLQANYQEIMNQFTQEQQQIITNNLRKQGAEIDSKIRLNDVTGAKELALKALHDAQAEGVDISNDVADSIADVQVQTAEAKRDQEIFAAGIKSKEYYGGKFGNYVPTYLDNGDDLRGREFGDRTKLGVYNTASKKHRSKRRR